MKLKLPLVAAFVAILSLSACGGGGSGSSSSSAAVASPSQLSFTDSTVGTGAQATSGKTVNVTYTLWLYSDTSADHKSGSSIDSGTFSFTLGSGQVIGGFDQGVTGMQVGGTRTILVPASLGYGATGQGSVPPNAGLVFQVTLNSVK